MIKTKVEFKDNEIYLGELQASYIQNGDCCDNNGNVQELVITTQDGGGDKFFVIKTDRWAFNNIDELIDVLNDFIKRNESNT